MQREGKREAALTNAFTNSIYHGNNVLCKFNEVSFWQLVQQNCDGTAFSLMGYFEAWDKTCFKFLTYVSA